MRTAYKFVKEFGEGVDRICTELEQTGTPLLVFHPNYFILQTTLYEEVIDVPTNTRIATESTPRSTPKEKSAQKSTQKSDQKKEKWPEKWPKKAQCIIDAATSNPKISIQQLEITLNIGHTTIKKILKAMQAEGFIRRIGPDKGGHWEIIK